jgi:hypothetical protein
MQNLSDAAQVKAAIASFMGAGGVSDADRDEAWQGIKKAAKAFGMTIEDSWRGLSAESPSRMTIYGMAMALAMPDVAEHPNRHPFTGVLTQLDTPSTRPPEGSNGKLVILPRQVAEKALSSIMGMGVDYRGATGHDPKHKIGIITGAEIVGDEIHVEGFIFAQDFPDELAAIQAMRGRMGMSYELVHVQVEDPTAPVWRITSCKFTGAAILLKDKAAYQQTSLSAAAEEETHMNEMIEKLAASMIAQGEALTKLLAATEKTHELLAAKGQGGDGQADDGDEGDTSDGDKEKLEAAKKKADKEKVDAAKLKADDDMEAAKAEKEKLDAAKKDDEKLDAAAAQTATEKRLVELQAEMGALMGSLKAAAQVPVRQTMSPEITALLQKAGIGINAGADQTISVDKLDAAMETAGITDITQRLAIKSALSHAELLQ